MPATPIMRICVYSAPSAACRGLALARASTAIGVANQPKMLPNTPAATPTHRLLNKTCPAATSLRSAKRRPVMACVPAPIAAKKPPTAQNTGMPNPNAACDAVASSGSSRPTINVSK